MGRQYRQGDEALFRFEKTELNAHEHLNAAFGQVMDLLDEQADRGEALAAHNEDAAAHADLREAVGIGSAAAVAAHNTDPAAHGSFREALAGKGAGVRLQEAVARVERLELMLTNDISKNPFMVGFEALDGLVVEGVWNQAQRQIEF